MVWGSACVACFTHHRLIDVSREDKNMKAFEKGARVCFVGDSITHNGLYIAYVLDYYRRHFPDVGVEIYNCGISGGTLKNAMAIYGEDTAVYEPTHIVLTFGVNDSCRDLLCQPRTKERYERLRNAYGDFGERLDRFLDDAAERGISVTLCTPPPYAEYIPSETAPLPGGCALIEGYAELVRRTARERGLPLCDYNAALTAAIQSEDIISPDRVHPLEAGHRIMAETFLRSQGLEPDGVPLTEEALQWRSRAGLLRNLIATEYFIVPDYINVPRCERAKIIANRLAAVDRGEEIFLFFEKLMREYVVKHGERDSLVEWLKAAMKN